MNGTIKVKISDFTNIQQPLPTNESFNFTHTYDFSFLSGYTESTQVSQQVFVTEGQKVEVRFRGNLQPDEDIQLEQPFNSNMKCQINMYIAEVDKYAQKSFSSYRGFAQFYVEGGCSYVSMNSKAFRVYHVMVEFD